MYHIRDSGVTIVEFDTLTNDFAFVSSLSVLLLMFVSVITILFVIASKRRTFAPLIYE